MITASLALAMSPMLPADREFDFWVGEWECIGRMNQGPDKWQETRGRNVIRKILKGKIVEENFEMPGLVGRSVTAYNPQRKKWFQTWVDDGGAYIALSGGMQGKNMILTTNPGPKNSRAFSRMVFSNVTPESFRWRWEGTKDAGRNWSLQWELNYRRVKKETSAIPEAIMDAVSHFGLPLV